MRPQRVESMSSSARRVQWNAPVRFVSSTVLHSSAPMRIARPSARTPALLTSTRTGPKRSRTWSNAAWTCSGSLTSAWTSPRLRASVTTVKPSSRRRWAIAAPMPRVPPVTSATGCSTGRAPFSRADMHALLPGDDARAPDEAGAEGGERHRRTRAQETVALGLPQRQRDGRRRRVRDLGDVERHALGVAVDLAALHAQLALVDLGVEEVGVRAVGVQLEAAAAEIELPARNDDGAGAVAEQDGGPAVLVVR